MSKSRLRAVAVLLAIAPAASAQAMVLGPDAGACAPGGNAPAVLAHVEGFSTRAGMLRVQLYGDKPEDFLASGKKLKRIEMPVTPAGPMDVCVAVPHPGTYAIAVRHDTAGNGPDWNDGGGFSRNPRLSLLNLRPSYASVAFPVGNGVKVLDIVLNYRQGLAIRPAAQR